MSNRRWFDEELTRLPSFFDYALPKADGVVISASSAINIKAATEKQKHR
jgi:hypothetical protein